MKKIIKYLLIMSLLFVFPMIVKANSISNIDIDIYVDKNGTGHVTEVWNAYINEGTEGYKPYYNLGNARITNFKVSDNGVNYTYLNSWNTNASKEQKAYKNGINYISDGLELCFGLSSNGSHKYKLTYDIEGFVSTNEDSDMIYWTLMPHNFSVEPDNVHMKIYSDYKYSNSLPVWGYGNYGGTAYVYDGYIEMNSEGVLDSNEYMTILVKFDKGTFNTYNKVTNNFDYYYKMAEEGAVHYKEENKKSFNLGGILKGLFNILFYGIIFFIIIKNAKKASRNLGSKSVEFGKGGKNIPTDIPNYRDIPFGEDIFKTYWISTAYKISKKKTDFLGAILLKWLKEKKISIKKIESGIFKKEETAIILNKDTFTSTNTLEINLHTMMYQASKDGVLESKEFEKWCKNNYDKILSWFDDVIDEQTEKFVTDGKITVISKKNVFSSEIYEVNPIMKEDAIKLKGLKNFLEDFSRIDTREAIEVNNWEYYLIYAQILGIADKVAEQFKKLYPELVENPEYNYNYNDIIFINHISHSGMREASASKSRAENYSSGGGGFSSGGGGGGSFGGGSSGGGGFR